MIEIEKINESFLKIHCDEGIARELSSFFTFKIPNHEFTPAFRRKKWDGKIRLFNLASRTIYAGLIDYLEKFFTDRSYLFTKKNFSIDVPTEKEILEWIEKQKNLFK